MFVNRLFQAGRQLLTSSLAQRASLPLQNVRNISLADEPKIEFLKPATVDPAACQDVIEQVNERIENQTEGRLFAVVQLCGKQFKVTSGDIIIIEGYWPPTTGDQIRLDKVLLVGGEEFTLIGRPLVQPGLVDIHATVIEKTIAHTKPHFRKKRRKQYQNIKFHRSAQSMIRINKIEFNRKISDNEHSPFNRLTFQLE